MHRGLFPGAPGSVRTVLTVAVRCGLRLLTECGIGCGLWGAVWCGELGCGVCAACRWSPNAVCGCSCSKSAVRPPRARLVTARFSPRRGEREVTGMARQDRAGSRARMTHTLKPGNSPPLPPPVHLEMISAMSASVTSSLSSLLPVPLPPAAAAAALRASRSSASLSCFCSDMSVPYLSSAAL